MSTPEGWYDDPAAPGRLRYWDGSDWTEWVNEGGDSRSEPLGPPPAPAGQAQSQATAPPVQDDAAAFAGAAGPTPGVQPAPHWSDVPPSAPPADGPAAGVATTQPASLQRLGFALVGAAGVVGLFSIGQAATRVEGGSPPGYDVGNGPFIVGVGFLAAAALALFVRQSWARAAAQVLASVVLLMNIFFLIGARGGDLFPVDTPIEIKSGWWILTVSAIVAIAGILLSMLGSARKRKSGLMYVAMALAALVFVGLLLMAFATDPSASWVKDSR